MKHKMIANIVGMKAQVQIIGGAANVELIERNEIQYSDPGDS